MNSRDGHTSSPAPTIQEQHEARLTAAKTRANDSNDRLTRKASKAELDAYWTAVLLEVLITGVLPAPDDERMKWLKEYIPAEEDALDQTEVRDVEEPGKDVSAEEVVLDTTVDRDGEEPGEDASPEGIALDRKTARDYDESGEDEPPTKSDNFDDTDSEDGTVPKPVINPSPPPASDPTLQDRPPSTPFRLKVNTVSGPKSDHDHKPELTFTSTPTNASDQPSANYDQEWLQTSPPPDPSVPTPKRDSRNRQSRDYHTTTAHIHFQIYGYPPYGYPLSYYSHDGSNVNMDSDSEDGHGHYGDEASNGGHYGNEYDSDEYEYAGCNHYRGDSDDEGY
ncbi:hypothetical protein THAOC_37300 [Thalassiosira oceanica]|uniref:Uncharacterized protein n=1 Tax=Thalassiosira oceanica TaxID=159749 RepID=K0QYL0_THAOC|nr:hypothetical protein THAOC_37300 [Thalassiosira oceanica]|eukprot:EJK44183.1 hypothetical protein THAOC_37300 [Thalassiosira oceanica]